MLDSSTDSLMEQVHTTLTTEFGRLAAPLEKEGRMQPVYLPGGVYAVSVVASSPTTLTVRKAIGAPDWNTPGLSDFLLREHGAWLFGRLERTNDVLAVEHTLHASQLDTALVRVVHAVHSAAIDSEQLLTRAGALNLDDYDEPDNEFGS